LGSGLTPGFVGAKRLRMTARTNNGNGKCEFVVEKVPGGLGDV
jgi:hypothetical protein